MKKSEFNFNPEELARKRALDAAITEEDRLREIEKRGLVVPSRVGVYEYIGEGRAMFSAPTTELSDAPDETLALPRWLWPGDRAVFGLGDYAPDLTFFRRLTADEQAALDSFLAGKLPEGEPTPRLPAQIAARIAKHVAAISKNEGALDKKDRQILAAVAQRQAYDSEVARRQVERASLVAALADTRATAARSLIVPAESLPALDAAARAALAERTLPASANRSPDLHTLADVQRHEARSKAAGNPDLARAPELK